MAVGLEGSVVNNITMLSRIHDFLITKHAMETTAHRAPSCDSTSLLSTYERSGIASEDDLIYLAYKIPDQSAIRSQKHPDLQSPQLQVPVQIVTIGIAYMT